MSLECVILLHGLARTDLSMKAMAIALADEGYLVINHCYPSRTQSIQLLAEQEIPKALSECPESIRKIHFVTHSMGGILLRQYLVKKSIPSMGRVVMLGPPNQGSEVVDKLNRYAFFKLLNGPAGLQLGTSCQSVPNSLGAWPAHAGELGVIAGKQSINLFLSLMIPGIDDGKVSVARTMVEGMHDHKIMPTTHPMMVRNKRVIAQVKRFLQAGQFAL